MKYILGVVVALFVAVGWFVPQTSAASLNNFTISNYTIDYMLGRDAKQRSTLKTTETITAEFPAYDQNHGIERAIPKNYEGHSTSLQILSVTDQSGKSHKYTTYESNDNLVIRIGDASSYVHGSVTYKIVYSQQDVTRFFEDTGADEFYWDTNGTEWAVPIQNLHVTLQFADELAKPTPDRASCYQGRSGARTPCTATSRGDGYAFSTTNLGSYENMTLAVGFPKKTFAAYQQPLIERVLAFYFQTLFILGVIGIGVIVWLFYKFFSWNDRHKERGTTVPEYLPPKDTSLTIAANLINNPIGSVFTAQLLDFAVRHYIKIYQTKDKGWFRSAQYDIEIIRDITDLPAEEQEILRDIFVDAKVGARIGLDSLQNNMGVYTRFSNNDKKFKTLIRGKYGIRHRDETKKRWFTRAGVIILVLAIVTFNPIILSAAMVAFACGTMLWPLTDKGLALSRYLKGLEMYIKVAEVDRLKMLQSPEGAQKVSSIDPNDSAQLVKLYERVLPYAVLFGQEKEWTKRIGDYYTKANATPDWYAGNTAFNAAVFSSAMSSFSSAASYTTASSSSSGGSSGGGSSGGGGGGGGGGGW